VDRAGRDVSDLDREPVTPHAERPAERFPDSPVQRRPHPLRRLGSGLIAGLLLLAKWAGAALGLLLKTKFLFSFLISVGAWALFAPLPFAVGLVTMLLVHELGHAAWAKREGLKVAAITFVPFLGAATLFERPHDVYTDAKIALAGPAVGGIAAGATLALAEQQGSDVIRMVAYVGFLLNLFNLIPVVPLDGGVIAQAFHPYFWLVGLFAMSLLTFAHPNILLVLILGLCIFSFYRAWTHRDDPAYLAYRRIGWPQRIAVGGLYLVIAALLVLGMETSYVHRSF
jgi:Zn-dependent protease